MDTETKMGMLDIVADSYIAKGGTYAEIGNDVKSLVRAHRAGTTPPVSEREIAKKVASLMGITTGNCPSNIEDVLTGFLVERTKTVNII